MNIKQTIPKEELRYLSLLANQYPTVQAASREIVNLQAILNLPKGCEHFISDVHGEYEAFLHVLNSCSGVVKEKLEDLYGTSMTRAEREELATLIYYPEEKLEDLKGRISDLEEFYRITLHRLVEICRLVSARYTRAKVRKALPQDYAYIIEELLHTHREDPDKKDYFESAISAILETGEAPASLPPSARSSSTWRWTTCIWWETSLTAAPGRISLWTPF